MVVCMSAVQLVPVWRPMRGFKVASGAVGEQWGCCHGMHEWNRSITAGSMRRGLHHMRNGSLTSALPVALSFCGTVPQAAEAHLSVTRCHSSHCASLGSCSCA